MKRKKEKAILATKTVIDGFQSSLSSQAAGMDLRGDRMNQAPPITQAKESWVSVAQKKQVLKKYDFEILESAGKKSVEVPTEVI